MTKVLVDELTRSRHCHYHTRENEKATEQLLLSPGSARNACHRAFPAEQYETGELIFCPGETGNSLLFSLLKSAILHIPTYVNN